MPVDSSTSSESTRYSRAAEQALQALNGSAATEPTPERRKRAEAMQSPDARHPARPGGSRPSKISDIVAAFAGSPDENDAGTVWTDPAAEGFADPERDQQRDKEESGRSGQPSPPAPDRPALDLSDDDDDPFADKPARRRKPLAEFMEKHGIGKPDQIYDLEVPFSDRDGVEGPVTIGELKDHYKQSRNFTRERDDFEDYRVSTQNEMITARQELDSSMGMLRQTFGDDVLREIFPKAAQQLQQQALMGRRQLAEWFPEWDDAQVKAADREKVGAMLKTYGFSAQEFEHILDPRLVRFAVHAMRVMERYHRAKHAWKEREKQPSREQPSRIKHRPNVNETADRLAKTGDKVGAVAALFGA